MKLNFNTNSSQADPYVIKSGDTYYMYVTGREYVNLFKSDNFFDWIEVGNCYQKVGDKQFWAPCVIELDDVFYMYVSSMPIDTEDVHQQKIQVAKANNPEGPFYFVRYLTTPFSIDPHVVKSGNDLYMFYAVNDYEAKRAGTYVVVDKMISPLQMVGKPKAVVRPTLDEEIFMRDRFKKGQHWHTIEGPFYIRNGDYHYLMYSGNCYQNENYFIGYSVAHSKENDLTKLDFKKYPSDNIYAPLLRKNEFEEGTGHNSVLTVNGKTYVIYHGRDYSPNIELNDKRTARICEITFNDGFIKVVNR